MGLRIDPLRLALAPSRWRGLELMVHQDRALELGSAPRVLVEAPTGGGKTWTAGAPLLARLEHDEGAIFVYPTNALADDQRGSLLDLARRAGHPAAVVRADGGLEGDDRAHVAVLSLHSTALDAVEEELGGKTRGDSLGRLLRNLPAKPLWLLTNPDTLFLVCTARYTNSPQLWSRLEACRTLVFDEFHLYRGPSLVRALALIELARVLLGVERIRILSATLPAALGALLRERFGFERLVAEPSSTGRIVQHETTLETEIATSSHATERFVARILPLAPTLRAERRAPPGVPLVVLRQSVQAAIHLEDQLAAGGIGHDEIGVYRGLSSKAVRAMDGKTLVIGTSALEVGVDFHTTRLVFEATSGASFAQRLGRVGRHEPGSAVFVTSARVAAALLELGASCTRSELLERAAAVLAADNDMGAEFACSPWGGAVRAAAIEALRSRGRAMGGGERFDERIDMAESALIGALGATGRPELLSRKAQARLVQAIGFRAGLGSVEVFDVRERDRRGRDELGVYALDLAVFFRRATWLPSPDPARRPVVTGYGPARRLGLELKMATAGAGVHAPSREQIELRVDGRATAYEHLLRDGNHVVGLFPSSLRPRLSWREDVFDAPDGQVALLDDDAMVAGFLYSPSGTSV